MQSSALETLGLLDLNDLDASLGHLYDRASLKLPATTVFSDEDSDGGEHGKAGQKNPALAAACAERAAAQKSPMAGAGFKRPTHVLTVKSSGDEGVSIDGSSALAGTTMSPLAAMKSRADEEAAETDPPAEMSPFMVSCST